MKVVYKYEIPPDRGHTIDMPVDSTIVHVGLQGDLLMLWVEHGWVDENTARSSRRFDVFGTGQPIPLTSAYVGTFFEGPFVWHVYEITS